MRGKSTPPPPRQPLSQRRPKTAANAAKSRAVAKSLTSRKSTGKIPSKTKVRSKTGASTNIARPGALPVSDGHKPSRARAALLPPVGERAPRVYDRLAEEYPDAKCALDFRDPYELLVATILSAQCTDKRVNMVTPALFARYPDANALAAAKPEELEPMIKSTGFFRNKTKSLLGMSAAVSERHGGRIPSTMEELVQLPGVGRKTANVILGNAFHRDEGVVVDTHVTRLSYRLGFTRHDDPVKIEEDLIALFPRERWTMLAHLLIEHGRRVCDARKPKCESCAVCALCPSSKV
jgi:endonuclease III